VRSGLAPTLPEEATAIVAAAAEAGSSRRRARDDDADESMLAAFHLLVRRASQGIHRLEDSARRLDRAAIDRIETDLRWASRLMRKLVERSLPAALVRIRQGIGRDPATLSADEIRGLLSSLVPQVVEAIGSVEVARGQRLAAKVTLATDRLVAKRFAGRGPTSRAAAKHASGSVPIEGLFRDLVPWEELVLGPWRDASRLDRLDPASRRLLARRHGLGDLPPATIAELARDAREPRGRMTGRLVEAEREARRRTSGTR
jgi:hypothetical protein